MPPTEAIASFSANGRLWICASCFAFGAHRPTVFGATARRPKLLGAVTNFRRRREPASTNPLARRSISVKIARNTGAGPRRGPLPIARRHLCPPRRKKRPR